MIPAEALGRWNVAARDRSREFFNSIIRGEDGDRQSPTLIGHLPGD
jgi:hypothetical protein